MSIMGTRVVRVEDPRLLSTGGVYTEDLRDPRLVGALHAAFVRSPLAHARILSVDATAARGAPGVVAVLAAADLGLPAAPPMMPNYNQRVAVASMEGRAAAAVPDDGGRLTVWVSTQAAQLAKAGDRGLVGPAGGAGAGHHPCAGRRPGRRTWSGCARAAPRSTSSPSAATGTGRCSPTPSKCCRTPAPTRGSARSCPR